MLKPAYSLSFLLSINIFVWQNVLYFPNNQCISLRVFRDNADRIKESAKSGTKVFVCVARLPQSYLEWTIQQFGYSD